MKATARGARDPFLKALGAGVLAGAMTRVARASCVAACVAAVAAALAGCGTVAGNPKKPDTGGKPADPPGRGAFKADLPLIDFDIADATFGAGLGLVYSADAGPFDPMAQPMGEGDLSEKAFFNAYGRRLNGIVRELNATAKRVNALTKAHGVSPDPDAADDGAAPREIRFSNKGRSSGLSARIGVVAKGPHDREAVLCASGKPYQLLRWSTRGTDIELWRDFTVAQGEGEAKLAIVSRLRAKPGADGALELDMATSGAWSDADEDAEQGGGLVERLFTRKESGGAMTLRAVTDRFSGAAPALFSGDSYLVGRLEPLPEGRKGFDPTFVAYTASSKRQACRGGFDEADPDLWKPKFPGPRFCLGRAANGTPIATAEAFRAHVAKFESVGIAKSADLGVVALPKGLSCK